MRRSKNILFSVASFLFQQNMYNSDFEVRVVHVLEETQRDGTENDILLNTLKGKSMDHNDDKSNMGTDRKRKRKRKKKRVKYKRVKYKRRKGSMKME